MFATFANVDFQRTRFWCLTGAVAAEVYRRLGPDATFGENLIDKRISRKVCSNYRDIWVTFHKENAVPSPPKWSDWPITSNDSIMTEIGSTVVWKSQINYLIEVVVRRMTDLTDLEYIAEYDRMKKWYYKHASLLDRELEALHRIKGYIETARPAYQSRDDEAYYAGFSW